MSELIIQFFEFACIAVSLPLFILGTSLLAMLHNVSRPVVLLRTIAAITSVCVSLWFLEYAPLHNLNDSPDGAAASPTFSLGPAIPILLLGAVLSASGLGLIGIGALVGAFIGGCIILIPFVGFLLLVYNGSLLASIVGSIIGGFTGRRIRRALLRPALP